MVKGSLHQLDKLLEGPLFADEVGHPNPLDEELMEMLDIYSLRLIPAKSAMQGVYTIYFREKHLEEALIRYVRRYRWIFEILLRAGLKGEEQLSQQGLYEEEIEFLREIIPTESEHNPIVYQILWKSKVHNKYIHLASELEGENKFIPQDIIDQSDKLASDDIGYFEQFVRCHLIESMESVRTRRHHHGGAGGDTISVDVESEYRLTTTGEEAIPAIVTEYERIFIEKNFEPLELKTSLEKDHSFEHEYEDVQIATSEEDDVLGVEDLEQAELDEYM
jgi:hypothetical protein